MMSPALFEKAEEKGSRGLWTLADSKGGAFGGFGVAVPQWGTSSNRPSRQARQPKVLPKAQTSSHKKHLHPLQASHKKTRNG